MPTNPPRHSGGLFFKIATLRVCFALVLATISQVSATPPQNAPSLSVHESAYGIELKGRHQESIQHIKIRIVSHANPAHGATEYEVQCFFLKRGKSGSPPAISDTVIFDAINPHGTYEVQAKPIKLSGAAEENKDESLKRGHPKTSKKSRSRPAPISPAPPQESPREGYVVRILSNDTVLRQRCSGHQVELFIKENPEFLDRAAAKKSARRMDAQNLRTDR